MDVPDNAIPYVLQPVQAMFKSPLERPTEKTEAFSEPPLQAGIEGVTIPEPPPSPQVTQQQMKERMHAPRRDNQSKVQALVDEIKEKFSVFKVKNTEDCNMIEAEEHIQQLETKVNTGIEQADLSAVESSIKELLKTHGREKNLKLITKRLHTLSELIDTPDTGIQPPGA